MHRTGRLVLVQLCVAVRLVVGHLVSFENPLLFSFVVIAVRLRIGGMVDHVSTVLCVRAALGRHTDSFAVFEVLIDLVLDLLT